MTRALNTLELSAMIFAVMLAVLTPSTARATIYDNVDVEFIYDAEDRPAAGEGYSLAVRLTAAFDVTISNPEVKSDNTSK